MEFNLAELIYIIVGINLVGWVITALTRTHKITDLFGTGSFLIINIVAAVTYKEAFTSRMYILCILSGIWGLRLVVYLEFRILSTGKDDRFHNFMPEDGSWCKAPTYFPLALAGFWILQALWCIVVYMPYLIIMGKVNIEDSIEWYDYIFIVGACVGWFFETVGDLQKYKFKSNDTSGGFIQTGLWSITRHPNYFGELLFWYSFFGLCASYLKDWEFLSVCSPLFITWLLLFVSGVSMLENKYDKRYADNREWALYKKKTAKLIPFIW